MFDEIDLLRAIEPDDQSSGSGKARAAEKLAKAIQQAERADRRFRRPRTRRRIGIAVAIAAALAAILVVELLPSKEAGPSRSAAEVLNSAADVAAKLPARAVGPGSYAYTKSQSLLPNDITSAATSKTIRILVPQTIERWVAPDGSGQVVAAAGEPQFVSPADKQAWIDAGKPEIPGSRPADQTYAKGGLPYHDFSGISTDPSTVLKSLRDNGYVGDAEGPSTELVYIGEMLREPTAPPEVRAALYHAAAQLPGVTLSGPVLDHAGRKGIAVGITTGRSREELIFDPQTSQLLEERTVDIESGQVTSWETLLDSKIVSSAQAKP